MFWKNIRLKFSSLVLQLTALYALSMMIILFIIMVILYFSLQHYLYQSDKRFLTNEYYLIKNMLNAMPLPQGALEQEIVLEPLAMKADERYYIKINNPHLNKTIITPNMGRVVSQDDFPQRNNENSFNVKVCQHCQKQMLLLSGSIEEPKNQSVWSIQIALYTYKKAEILEEYWQTLIIISITGTLISALLGWWLAHRNMRPLHRIIKIITDVSTNKLPTISIPSDWPNEFYHLAETLNVMFSRLDNSFKQLTQFSADLAHELRTPLNNLKGETEIALLKSRTDAEYKQILSSNLEEYNRLARIIDGLLFLARAEIPQATLQCQYVDLKQIIDKIVEFYLPVAEERNIHLNATGSGKAFVDELMVERALHNLLSNALRYTDSGGSININIESTIDKINIQVRDTGTGISKEHLPFIFNRFYRADDKHGNSGLGLAIVKSIMDLHGGGIHIKSSPGMGTHITLTFPTK